MLFRQCRSGVLERPPEYSSVAQWQSIRLLTGGLLVRVQPEEPIFLANLSTRPVGSAFCDMECDITSVAGRSIAAFFAADVTGADGSSAAAAWFSASRRMWL